MEQLLEQLFIYAVKARFPSQAQSIYNMATALSFCEQEKATSYEEKKLMLDQLFTPLMVNETVTAINALTTALTPSAKAIVGANTSATSFANGTATRVIFTNTTINTASMFNSSRFTPTRDMNVLASINATIEIASLLTQDLQIHIYVNGSLYISSPISYFAIGLGILATNSVSVNFTYPIHLGSGQTVDIYATQNNSGAGAKTLSGVTLSIIEL